MRYEYARRQKKKQKANQQISKMLVEGTVPWITMIWTQFSHFIGKEGRGEGERAEEGVLDEGLGVTFSELRKCG